MTWPAYSRIVPLALLLFTVTSGLPAQETGSAEGIASPITEQKLTAEIDVANRWVQDVGGSQNVYRSLVNLGEGPRLFSGQARFRDAGGKYIDRLDVIAHSWGGDPYNTARVDAELSNVYSLRFDYRNVTYFNNLPSFANPLLADGILLSQRSLDLDRRQADTELQIKPGSIVSPFFSFYHGSGFGRGVTTFVSDGNEFPVTTDLDDTVNSFRGGVRLNSSKFNVTLEQGRTTFEDEQAIFFSEGGERGNRRRPLLGQDLILDELDQRYEVEGSGVFNRGVVQGRPWKQLHFTGQFLYSQPSVDVRYNHEALGSFVLLREVAPFTLALEESLGDAKRPFTSGSWNTEIRPAGRVRVVQSWYTDRFHVAGGSFLAQNFNTVPETNSEAVFTDLLTLNYNQHQVDAIVDVHPNVTVRGGHRYVWGDARAREATLRLSPDPRNTGEVRRHVGLAGAGVRLASDLSVTFDFEASPGDQTFFRTGLMEYHRAKVRARYRIHPSLTVSGSFLTLNNENPDPGVDFDLRSQQSSISVYWTPSGGRRFTVLADYTRSTLRTDIPIVSLPFLGDRELARYRDKGHHGGAFAEVQLVKEVRLNVGGSLSINEGSRPTRYYQPQARLIAPVVNRVSWTAEWRWFNFDEKLFTYENFRTHIFSTGLRLQL